MPKTNPIVLAVLALPLLASWFMLSERGRDLVAVTFCRGRSFLAETVVHGERRPSPTAIRKLHPYAVSSADSKPRLVLAASAAEAARVLLRGDGTSSSAVRVECTTHRYRVIEASPGTWAMVWLPTWLDFVRGAPCEHGATESHVGTFGGERRGRTAT